MDWMYERTALWTGWPRAAKALRVGWEKIVRGSGREGRLLKPWPWVKALRSRTWSPIGIAGRFSEGLFLECMMPKGMLEREKWLSLGIDNHDSRGAILIVRGRIVMLIWMCSLLGRDFGIDFEQCFSMDGPIHLQDC